MVFPHRREIAVSATRVPLIATADIAIEPGGIDTERFRLVVAIDVLRDEIAQQSAQSRAAHDHTTIAMGGRAADQAAGQGAENGAGHCIAAVAVLFVAALLI